MHLSNSSMGKPVKEAIVLERHVAGTYDTEWEKLFPLYIWDVFESINQLYENRHL